MSGRKVELDEVIVPAPELESSSSQKSVPVIPTPISEEANDDDHETSDQVTTKPRRSTRVRSAPEWYGFIDPKDANKVCKHLGVGINILIV